MIELVKILVTSELGLVIPKGAVISLDSKRQAMYGGSVKEADGYRKCVYVALHDFAVLKDTVMGVHDGEESLAKLDAKAYQRRGIQQFEMRAVEKAAGEAARLKRDADAKAEAEQKEREEEALANSARRKRGRPRNS